jgi:hypothetical protein
MAGPLAFSSLIRVLRISTGRADAKQKKQRASVHFAAIVALPPAAGNLASSGGCDGCLAYNTWRHNALGRRAKVLAAGGRSKPLPRTGYR